jgi:hypothetical protein
MTFEDIKLLNLARGAGIVQLVSRLGFGLDGRGSIPGGK